MNTVYTAAFRDGMFLMVYNPERGGWEMPGGKMEEGETAEEAAVREFMEEAGYRIDILAARVSGGSWECVALLRERMEEGEMESRLCRELPGTLAFPRAGYEEMLDWADSVLAGGNQPFYTL